MTSGATLEERARAFVTDALGAADGKPPSDDQVEIATAMVCRAFAPEQTREPSFGDPLRIDPLWESRLRVLASEKGMPPRAYLLDLIRQQWNHRRSP